MSAGPHLDPDRVRRAREYRAFTLWLGVASTAAGIAAMYTLYALDQGIYVAYRTQVAPRPIAIYLVVAVFSVIGWAIQLPFAYAKWARGRREGLVVQSLPSAVADQLKGLVLTLLLFAVPLAAWYLILPRADWWLWTILGTAVLSALGILIGPALTSLFFRFEPLTDATVADRVRAVAKRAGVGVSGVYRIMLGAKTTAANAAVIGIGPTKRIALGDTLLAKFPIDEVESVVAHEVGHDVSGDPARYVVAIAVAGSATLIVVRVLVDAITGGTTIGGAADPASYPLIAAALGVVAFVSRPAFLAFTRRRERAADAFGARYTSRDAMARALVRLADQNLADPEPPRWEELFFYSHPAIANRVRALGLRWEDFGGTMPGPSSAPLSR